MTTDKTRTPAGIGYRILGFWYYLRTEGRIATNVTVFLVGAVVLIFFLVVSLFRIQPRYAVFATFEDSGGVFTGQEVTYRGVTVGRVGEMRVVGEGVRIELVIERTFNRIPREGTVARVMFKSAVGEQFVDLLPTSRTAPYLDEGDEIPIGDTRLPVQQEELLRLLDLVLQGVPPETIGSLVDVLGEGLGGRGDQLHAALAALDPLSATLAARTDELNRLSVSGDRVGTAFSATAPEFVEGVRSLGRTAAALGRGADGLEQLLVSGATYIPDLGGLVAARKAQIDLIIANLAEVTRISFENLKSVEDTIDFLPLLLDALVQSYDADLNRFRFGQIVADTRNPGCSYGTPRRDAQAEGNAPYHPILEFDCVP